jgi:glycosyltransferase 2 family protein
VKPWAKAAVSIGLLILLFVLLPWSQVREAIGRLPPRVWAGVLGGFVLGHAVGVLKWRLFVNAAKGALGRVDAALCYGAGLFANLCLPSIVGGDLLRLGLAGKLTRRPEAALWGGIMDRLTDLLSLALLVTAGGLLVRTRVDGWMSQVLTVGFAVAAGLALLVLPFAVRRPLARWPRRLRRPVGRGLVGLRQLRRRPGAAALGLAMSLGIQSSFVLLNAWLGRSLGIDVSLGVWFLVWPLAKIASLMPISLGGLAVREASLAALLLPFGVPVSLSVVCSLLWQTVLIAGGLLGGLVWLVLHRSRNISFRASHGQVTVSRSGGE